jgi:hypothetical protein
MSQIVDHLPNKCNNLSQTPVPLREGERKREGRDRERKRRKGEKRDSEKMVY